MEKRLYLFPNGEYSKPQTMTSQSVYINSTEIWNDTVYNSLVYTSSIDVLVTGDKLNKPYIANYSPISVLGSRLSRVVGVNDVRAVRTGDPGDTIVRHQCSGARAVSNGGPNNSASFSRAVT